MLLLCRGVANNCHSEDPKFERSEWVESQIISKNHELIEP